ncbi:MAG: F0F1 ATP synthase subunit epsilon [Acidobacteriota bacterium]|jgi:F-type H+-transporting ATPase subunit epsilon|nr:F0F1 ATP synthase subunit epsilon [Acidobacteriota bacterium]|tara:strand:- start:2471 stop:2887 length:417 start_codon:yes stop_codon:yes gene_type:complete
MTLPSQLTLEVVTPDRSLVSQLVDEVQIPGAEGYFGVLPGHTPLLVTMNVGELWYRNGQQRSFLSIALGFAEVLPDRVTILAKVAECAEDIDVERAQLARQRAEERLTQRAVDSDGERARLSLLRSRTRLQVASQSLR